MSIEQMMKEQYEEYGDKNISQADYEIGFSKVSHKPEFMDIVVGHYESVLQDAMDEDREEGTLGEKFSEYTMDFYDLDPDVQKAFAFRTFIEDVG